MKLKKKNQKDYLILEKMKLKKLKNIMKKKAK